MRAERGAATVELALMAMFLVLLVAGIVDFGRGLYTTIALDDAVHEGAVFAAFTEEAGGSPITADQIKARVVDSTSSPALSTDDVAVTCQAQTRARADASRVTVTVTHSVDLITPFISDWFGGQLTVSRSATVDRFFSDCPTGSTS